MKTQGNAERKARKLSPLGSAKTKSDRGQEKLKKPDASYFDSKNSLSSSPAKSNKDRQSIRDQVADLSLDKLFNTFQLSDTFSYTGESVNPLDQYGIQQQR